MRHLATRELGRFSRLCPILLVAIFVFSSCTTTESDLEYVARVGDQYFTLEDMNEALAALSVPQDSVEASEQILDQWITDELLFREAVRRGLHEEENVQKLLLENERSLLVSVLLNKMFEEQQTEPEDQELYTYYEQHKDQLRLTEPFVRIRYLVVQSPDSAALAVDLLGDVEDSSNPDSAWQALSTRFTEDLPATIALSSSYYPESRILSSIPGLSTAVGRLDPGQILSPFEVDERLHIVQLVGRLPVGSIPEVQLLEEQLTARIAIENRKQLYARQVQRLRNEALAREELDIR